MMKAALFTENETGIEVLVETPFRWGAHPMQCIVTYPASGRRYAIPESEFNRHFSVVSPQEIFIQAYGAVDDRPTEKQLALSELATKEG